MTRRSRNMADLLFREEKKEEKKTLRFDLLKESTENFHRRGRGRSPLYGADGPNIHRKGAGNHHWKVWYRLGIWRLRVSESERYTAEIPASAESKAECAANGSYSSYTPNSTAAGRNWRRRPHSSCRPDSQCSGDRKDEEGGT